MEFKEAMDRLRECPTREVVARALGVSFATVQQAMLPETSPGRRPAPTGWQAGMAKLARRRSAQLAELANRLKPREEVPVPAGRAAGMLDLASEFMAAAAQLEPEGSFEPPSMVRHYLLGHALELVFKSILVAAGTTEDRLRDLGHDLGAVLDAAQDVAPEILQLDEQESASVGALSPVYRKKGFEYVVPMYASLPPSERLLHLADRLHPAVTKYVRTTLRSARAADHPSPEK